MTSGSESVQLAQRNVLNRRGRLLPEGTHQRASIRLLLSTGKVFVLRLATPRFRCVSVLITFHVGLTVSRNSGHST